MNRHVELGALSDADLLVRCRAGDHDAFRPLVERHQSLICSLAYTVCGNLHQSEDVAQEAFVIAWRKLGELREPTRFKAWLCAIASNLARALTRRNSRHPESSLEEMAEPVAATPAPDSLAVSREEEALMWSALAGISETYRVPLVLYYREHQSIAAVAQALDLSDEAVRQRLARGRSMLKQQVVALVEGTLGRTRPGRTFTAAVLAALPAVLPAQAAMGTLVATTAKGAAAKAGGAGMAHALAAIAGPLIGLMGGWIGMRVAAESARFERERTFLIRRTGRLMFTSALIIAVPMLVTILAGDWVAAHQPAVAGMWVAWLIGFMVWTGAEMASLVREQRRIQLEESTAGITPRAAWDRHQRNARAWTYRSQASWLGLPLIDISFGARREGRRPRGGAKGWIAIGDVAHGVIFAAGGWAVGGIAIGGIAMGGFAFGGLGLAAFAYAGMGIGWWSFGGLVVGVKAFGGLAVGVVAAFGGIAVSMKSALGGLAVASAGGHANDQLARAQIESDPFFQWAEWVSRHPIWLALVTLALLLLPLLIGWVVWRLRGGPQPAEPVSSAR